MGGFRRRQIAVVVLLSATSIVAIQSCATVEVPLLDVSVLPGALPFWRAAAGGGFVTVNTAVEPGAVAVWNAPPTTPTTYAIFDNNGEGNKHEKRYDLKKYSDAYYSLVLSKDPGNTSRTKWELLEWRQVNGKRVSEVHRSGHLWQCESYAHAPTSREVGFKDCDVPIPYDPSEGAPTPIASTEYGAIARFASSLRSEDSDLTVQSAPIWISCTTGCCSLGQ
jgi:hypothetical protein